MEVTIGALIPLHSMRDFVVTSEPPMTMEIEFDCEECQGDGRRLLNGRHVLLHGVQACDSQLPQLDVFDFNMTQILRQRRTPRRVAGAQQHPGRGGRRGDDTELASK